MVFYAAFLNAHALFTASPVSGTSVGSHEFDRANRTRQASQQNRASVTFYYSPRLRP